MPPVHSQIPMGSLIKLISISLLSSLMTCRHYHSVYVTHKHTHIMKRSNRRRNICCVSTCLTICAESFSFSSFLFISPLFSSAIQVILGNRMQRLGTWGLGTQYPQTLGKSEWKKRIYIQDTLNKAHITHLQQMLSQRPLFFYSINITNTGGLPQTHGSLARNLCFCSVSMESQIIPIRKKQYA